MSTQTIAIIGAGPSGLVTAKEAKSCGLSPTVFESSGQIGGIWQSGNGKVWDDMKINNSRHAASFSDFEWEPGAEDFPNQKAVFQYLCRYAEAFHLGSAIKFHSKIIRVQEVEGNQADKKRWQVIWENAHGQHEQRSFDFLAVCSGFLSRPFRPQIDGMETFTGTVLDAQDYKSPVSFANRRIAVIGNAYSGCEIAAEVAQTAAQVVHIFRNPRWIMTRYLKDKESGDTLPCNLQFYRRARFLASGSMEPSSVLFEQKHAAMRAFCQKQEEVPSIKVPPPYTVPPLSTISDTYLDKVKKGDVNPRHVHIERIAANRLQLSDKNEVEVDDIIFCTGYRTELAFLSDEMKKSMAFDQDDSLLPLPLYKAVFPANYANIAFIGMVRFGIYFGPVEMQARFATMTFSGKLPTPSAEELQDGVEEELAIRHAQPRIQLGNRDHNRYQEDLGRLIGVLPDFSALKQDNQSLHTKLIQGPFTSASFRLSGFASNPDVALRMIDDINKKAEKPLSQPECEN